MKKGQARGAPGLLLPVSAHHPLVGVWLFESPRRGAILAGRFMLAVGDNHLTQVAKNVMDLGCIARVCLLTELPTEVEDKSLGISHLDVPVFLP